MNLARQPYLVEIGYAVVDLGVVFALVAGISGFGGALSAKVDRRETSTSDSTTKMIASINVAFSRDRPRSLSVFMSYFRCV